VLGVLEANQVDLLVGGIVSLRTQKAVNLRSFFNLLKLVIYALVILTLLIKFLKYFLVALQRTQMVFLSLSEARGLCLDGPRRLQL